MLFQNEDDGIYYQHSKKLPAFFLYGQATMYAALSLHGTFNTIAVHFFPHALKTVFGLDAFELTNTCLDLSREKEALLLSEHLLIAHRLEEKIKLISTYLYQLIQSRRADIDLGVQHALKEIIRSRGSVSLKKIQDDLKLSERSIERKFKEYVGLVSKVVRSYLPVSIIHASNA
jgi:AraC-like DNA-binding protein